MTPDELNAIKARIPNLPGAVAEPMAALVAEVERRRDVYDLMGAVEHSVNTLAAHEDMGALKERADVVAWLRGVALAYELHGSRLVASVICDNCDAIERGEHREETR